MNAKQGQFGAGRARGKIRARMRATELPTTVIYGELRQITVNFGEKSFFDPVRTPTVQGPNYRNLTMGKSTNWESRKLKFGVRGRANARPGEPARAVGSRSCLQKPSAIDFDAGRELA